MFVAQDVLFLLSRTSGDLYLLLKKEIQSIIQNGDFSVDAQNLQQVCVCVCGVCVCVCVWCVCVCK